MGAGANGWDYQIAAKPFLSSDNTIYLTGFRYWGWPVYGWTTNLCTVSLSKRKIISRRRYLSGEKLARAAYDINQAKGRYKDLNEVPHKDMNKAINELEIFMSENKQFSYILTSRSLQSLKQFTHKFF